MLLDGSIVHQTQILMSVLGTYGDLTCYVKQDQKMICNITFKTKFLLLILIFWACSSVQQKYYCNSELFLYLMITFLLDEL